MEKIKCIIGKYRESTYRERCIFFFGGGLATSIPAESSFHPWYEMEEEDET